MLTFLIPSAFGFGGQTYWGHMPFTDYPNYMGILLLLLAIYGYYKNRTSLTHFLVVAWLLALLISFGSHFGLVYNLFYDYFPFFNKFRVPSMILVLVQFITVVLAGLGIKTVLEHVTDLGEKLKYPALGLGLLLVMLVFGDGFIRSLLSGAFTPPRSQDPRTIQYINSLRTDMWIRDAWIGLLLTGAAVMAIWIVKKNFLSARLFPIALLALITVDIGRVDWAVLYPEKNTGRQSQLIADRAIKRYFSEDEIIRFLQSDRKTPFRIYPVGPWFSDSRFRAFDIESVGGYHPAKLNNYNTFLSETKNASTLPLIKMLNARYLVSPQQLALAGTRQVKAGNMIGSRGLAKTYVYRVEGDLPRSWFVPQVVSLTSRKSVFIQIQEPDFDPYKTAFAVNDENIAGEYADGAITTSEYGLHQIRLSVETKGPAFMVLSEVYYPLRWRASIDGEPVTIHEMNGFMRGIPVPAGEHEVFLWYDRSYFRKGIMISILSLILGLAAVITGTFQRQKRL